MSEAVGEQVQDEAASLTIPEALQYAVHALQAGDGRSAEQLLERILAVAPDQPDALHFYGLVVFAKGRVEQAVDLIRRAIDIEPETPSMHNNLGNIFSATNQYELAAQAYKMTIMIDRENWEARYNLGGIYRALGELENAEKICREAVQLAPKSRLSWDNLAKVLMALRRPDEAIEAHLMALELEPRNPDTRRHLIAANAACKREDRAVEIVREWLADDPDSAYARHLHSALTGENVPERASDSYVQALFDSFSVSFDAKLAKLEYRAPQLVAQAVEQILGEPEASLALLDAGCGTGLCGPLLKPYAARLVGVDLSSGMLAKASGRDCYDDLEQAELTRYLLDHPGAYDLVVSADTLCYFGSLAEVVAAAAGSLVPGGRLFFTVEQNLDDTDIRLNNHGRYSHGESHVRASLEQAGLTELRLDRAHLRMELGLPVDGLVVSARRPGAPPS